MKKLFLIAAVAIFQFANAQKTVEIKSFSELAISGNIEVRMIESSENKLVIAEGEDTLQVNSDEGDLAISNESSSTAEVVIYFNGPIDEIALSGPIEMLVKGTISSKNLQLSVDGGTELNCSVYAENMSVAASSGSEIILSGDAKQLEIHAASGCELNASKLKTENTTVYIASGAEVSVYATGVVNAVVASGAELAIHGNPDKINETKANNAEITIVK
ncbi:head GIN domain-containing protein [Flavobacterium beibuense]|uniref:head GIN domain-containing protein n=1 Tax=Flavobacterium beibuense TaxID=657326 RepID=UPI003A953EFB